MKFYYLLLLAICFLLIGCFHKTNSIVGTWTYRDEKSSGNDTTYVFHANGTFTYTEHATYQSIHSHQSSSGTYYVQNHMLTINTLLAEMGIDADAMAAIDAREKKLNPNLHIPQDKGDVPIKIEQPTMVYLISINDDNQQLMLKDTSNAADQGHVYDRMSQ